MAGVLRRVSDPFASTPCYALKHVPCCKYSYLWNVCPVPLCEKTRALPAGAMNCAPTSPSCAGLLTEEELLVIIWSQVKTCLFF